jgi:hypothetical protein
VVTGNEEDAMARAQVGERRDRTRSSMNARPIVGPT